MSSGPPDSRPGPHPASRIAHLPFSVIVPAYNEEKELPASLRHLREAAHRYGRGVEFIVVDNASTDRTAEIARDFGAQVVREEKRQIARARNAGASVAAGEVLLFCDADSHVHPDTFVKIAELLQNPSIAGGGIRILPDDTRAVDSAGLLIWTLFSETFKISGGTLFCRRSAFEQVRGFPEEFFIGEEVMFQLRLKKYCFSKGLRTALLPGCPVVTSMRKTREHGALQYGWAVFRCFLFPWLAKQKKYCKLWYNVRQ